MIRSPLRIGSCTKVDKLEILWANGAVEFFDVPAIDKTIMVVIQGKGA